MSNSLDFGALVKSLTVKEFQNFDEAITSFKGSNDLTGNVYPTQLDLVVKDDLTCQVSIMMYGLFSDAIYGPGAVNCDIEEFSVKLGKTEVAKNFAQLSLEKAIPTCCLQRTPVVFDIKVKEKKENMKLQLKCMMLNDGARKNVRQSESVIFMGDHVAKDGYLMN